MGPRCRLNLVRRFFCGGRMGLFWDLLQQSQISRHADRAATLEQRVASLELELQRTQTVLRGVITILEHQSGKDVDGDGRIG